MDLLNDDCLLLIFHQLTLDQRAPLRLVSKTFRDLCDSIKIKQLIIYERNIPLAGRLQHTGQSYGLLDTACVLHLDKFFTNPILLNQMNLIRRLVVYGERDSVVAFHSASFDQLAHLELYRIRFADLTILKSPELEIVVLNDIAYSEEEMPVGKETIARLFGSREKMSHSIFLTGFNYVTSRKIRYLSLDEEPDANFFVYCTENELFNSIEHLNVMLSDLASLSFLSEHCPVLKRLDVPNNLGQLIVQLNESNTEEIANSLRDDLTVYLFGIPFNKKTASKLPDLLVDLGVMLERISSQLLIYLDPARFDLLQVADKVADLREFYKLIRNVSGNCQTIQAAMFYWANFAHCEMITFGLDHNLDVAFFQRFLAGFPHLKTITLASSFDFEYDQRIISLLTQHSQVTQLDLEIWNIRTGQANCFDFLLQFPRLKWLQLRLAQSVGPQLLIRLFEKLKYLNSLDLAFAIAMNEDEQLDAARRQVNDRLAGTRFRSPAKLVFKADVYCRDVWGKFVRYVVVREGDPYELSTESETRMHKMIEHHALSHY